VSPDRAVAHNPTARAVYPCLTYRDVRGAISWLENASGIEGQPLAAAGACDQAPFEHALLRSGGGTILVESERPDELHGPHAGRGWIYVAVTDADAHYRQVGLAAH
jgi:uncharacterized glyoxalase superfamily protein PhnB